MLVPISFKADGDASSKKGKVRAEDLSILGAFSLPSKTGLLRVLNECNYYDLTASSGTARVTLNNGYVVICGHIIYVESSTIVENKITLPISGSVTGSFGIRVNLSAVGDNECDFYAKTSDLVQEDLNANPTSGIYEFELYRYTATPNSCTFTKTAKIIEPRETGYTTAATYPASRTGVADTTKSIAEWIDEFESRLTTLGFSTASTSSFAGVSGFSFKRVGNIVYASVQKALNVGQSTINNFLVVGKTVFTMPEGYRPKAETPVYMEIEKADGNTLWRVIYCDLKTNGDCVVSKVAWSNSDTTANIKLFRFTLGYEVSEE